MSSPELQSSLEPQFSLELQSRSEASRRFDVVAADGPASL